MKRACSSEMWSTSCWGASLYPEQQQCRKQRVCSEGGLSMHRCTRKLGLEVGEIGKLWRHKRAILSQHGATSNNSPNSFPPSLQNSLNMGAFKSQCLSYFKVRHLHVFTRKKGSKREIVLDRSIWIPKMSYSSHRKAWVENVEKGTTVLLVRTRMTYVL